MRSRAGAASNVVRDDTNGCDAGSNISPKAVSKPVQDVSKPLRSKMPVVNPRKRAITTDGHIIAKLSEDIKKKTPIAASSGGNDQKVGLDKKPKVENLEVSLLQQNLVLEVSF